MIELLRPFSLCRYNSVHNIIEVTTYGPASFPELIEIFNCIAELCVQQKSANILIDHSDLDVGALSMNEINNPRRLTASAEDILKMRKCAHVAVKDLQYGLVRAWEIMVEVNGFDNLETKIFRNRNEAIEWPGTS